MPFFERRLPKILEKLIKALFEWLASLWYEMVEYLLEHLMDLFHTDLTYFADRVPVVEDIGTIFFAVGWALLIGNLVFQAMRSMASGVGIEAEEPGRLFLRTAMFSFLLMVSRQICEIGLGLSSTIMDMLQIPNAITFDPFGEDTFDMLPNAGWIVVILVNVIIQWQTIKLFFEVAERYVILCVLTYCAPLAFAMGGSKSTGEIFRGWLRMFASMCALMVFNLMFVKLLISAMSNAPNGTAIIPWMMLAGSLLFRLPIVIGCVRKAKPVLRRHCFLKMQTAQTKCRFWKARGSDKATWWRSTLGSRSFSSTAPRRTISVRHFSMSSASKRLRKTARRFADGQSDALCKGKR